MTDLEIIRSRIPGYAGYAGDDARHEVDKQIRAYLGEALAAARDALRPPAAVGEQLEGLLLRCEFADQRVLRAADHARFDAALVERLHCLDRELIEAADGVRATTAPESLAGALDAAARALDERLGAIAEAPSR
ncbi:MAG TPA: hypothetical protein VGC96_00240 [Candidatus Elarobacter sp.]|jgi:hypothetical protein